MASNVDVQRMSGAARVVESIALVAAFVGMFAPWGYAEITWLGKTRHESIPLSVAATPWTARLLLLAIVAGVIVQFISPITRYRFVASLTAGGISLYFVFTFFSGADEFNSLGGSFLPN